MHQKFFPCSNVRFQACSHKSDVRQHSFPEFPQQSKLTSETPTLVKMRTWNTGSAKGTVPPGKVLLPFGWNFGQTKHSRRAGKRTQPSEPGWLPRACPPWSQSFCSCALVLCVSREVAAPAWPRALSAACCCPHLWSIRSL